MVMTENTSVNSKVHQIDAQYRYNDGDLLPLHGKRNASACNPEAGPAPESLDRATATAVP